jgi:hypothetical protein
MKRLYTSLIALTLAACSDGNEESRRSSSAMSNASDASSATTLPSTQTTLPGDPPGSSDPTTGPGHFRLNVAATFSKDCSSCHSSASTIKAPLSIYDYFKAKKMLAAGSSGTSNELMDRLTGVRAHGGGKICDVGTEKSACNALEAWYEVEVAQGTLNNFDTGVTTTTLPGQSTTTTTTLPPGSPDPRSAGISAVSVVGLINGWAVDKQDLTRQITVSIVVGGLLGQGGVEVGTATANRAGPDGNHPGDHRFEFQLSRAYADGAQRTLYVYNGTTLLLTTGFQYQAWAPSAAGATFFRDNVEGGLRAAGCGPGSGCHGFTYESAYPYLLVPRPVAGTTAAGALLVTRPSLTGTTHGGGRRCNDVNSGVCEAIQRWWNMEFR